MVSQEEIHKQCLSFNWNERLEAVGTLRDHFSEFSNKEQAWMDLITLIEDEKFSIRWKAAKTVGSICIYIPDKEKAFPSSTEN